MTEKSIVKGACACGAVKVQAEVAKSIGACHCATCRAWTGGPFMTIDGGSDVSFAGEENIAVYDSSDWAARGFCRNCGSHLFYRLKKENHYILSAGIFGVIDGAVFDHQVFVDQKPGFYSFANKTHDMTGEELFAQFAPSE